MKKFLISTHGFDLGIGGIKVLHRLCHLLNENGHDAYLIPLHFDWPFAVYEGYNTKLATQEIMDNLDDVIVVYPESWIGNYLNAPNVVRWMLNFPSKDHVNTWHPTDLWFWYVPQFFTGEFKKDIDNVLYVGETHRDIFYDMKLPRNGSCWTIRKANVSLYDYENQKGTFIPYHAAGDLPYLTKLFNSTERFYCYDHHTYMTLQSVMCNTDAIVVPNDTNTPETFLRGWELNKYVAYGESDIDRARAVRNELSDHLNQIEKTTITQLHTFVEKCHAHFK